MEAEARQAESERYEGVAGSPGGGECNASSKGGYSCAAQQRFVLRLKALCKEKEEIILKPKYQLTNTFCIV